MKQRVPPGALLGCHIAQLLERASSIPAEYTPELVEEYKQRNPENPLVAIEKLMDAVEARRTTIPKKILEDLDLLDQLMLGQADARWAVKELSEALPSVYEGSAVDRRIHETIERLKTDYNID